MVFQMFEFLQKSVVGWDSVNWSVKSPEHPGCKSGSRRLVHSVGCLYLSGDCVCTR